jgi:sulfite reductase beta subunit-like hemoprotein
VRKIDGERVECFQLLAGGDRGAGPRLGNELQPAVPADRVPEAVVLLDSVYRASRDPDEPFAYFVQRTKDILAR